jgi:hypothetical protein
MECKYCKKILSSKSAMNAHQKRTKYCLKIQGKNIQGEYTCDNCGKNFFNNNTYIYHQKTLCQNNTQYIILKKELENLKDELRILNDKYIASESKNNMLMEQLEKTQNRYDNLSLVAVKRPTTSTSTKNIQINNYIQKMEPLRLEDITNAVPQLTLDHHVKGAEGYAEYALEFPFKDKIVCVDVNRNKIKYKNGEGDVIEDIGFRKMMTKLCESLKDRTFNLCQEHYEKLSGKFTEKEMEEYNFMGTALAITRYASGRESEFCNKVIKLISKGSKK